MIILDEQLKGRKLEEEIAKWYGGSILSIKELRPGTVIKDEAIPQLLCQLQKPTFVTINVIDFWEKLSADSRFCVVCFAIKDSEVGNISPLLRNFFSHTNFKTKTQRSGHVVRITLHGSIRYYRCNDNQLYSTLLDP